MKYLSAPCLSCEKELRCHAPYRLLKIKSAALLFKNKKCRVIRRYRKKMRKCEGVTKYKCFECFTFVLYIWSKCREDHDIYTKEEK